jgi:hypothetical protein
MHQTICPISSIEVKKRTKYVCCLEKNKTVKGKSVLFDRRVDFWGEFEVPEEEECSMLLVKVEVPCAHYLAENKIAWHCTHVLSSTSTPMPLTILPAKQNQKGTISFHHPRPNK